MDQAQSIPAASLSPVANQERIQVLDLLRGFAIIGILLMNIEWFDRPITELLNFDMSQTGSDWAASWLVLVFVQGKFYKLFSLLFGMGFAVMLLRAQEKQRPFGWWFTRRMFALYLFGIAHMVFFWGGDILHDYAIAGMLLLGIVGLLKLKWLRRFDKPATFAKIGFTLLLLPLVISIVVGIFFGATRDNSIVTKDWQSSFEVTQKTNELIKSAKANGTFVLTDDEYKTLKEEFQRKRNAKSEQSETSEENQGETGGKQIGENQVTSETLESSETNEWVNDEQKDPVLAAAEQNFKRKQMREYRIEQDRKSLLNSSFWEVTKYRWEHTKKNYIQFGFAFGLLLPVFLIGYWLVASGRIRKPNEHKTFFSVMMWGGLGFGLIMSLAAVLIQRHPAAEGVMTFQAVTGNIFHYSQFILCAGYVGLFVKLVEKQWFTKFFGWLAGLGKMALTNYIMHSAILSFIFFGYGGAMLGQVPRSEQMGIVVVIIAVQAVLCPIWLRYFNFGPLEWLWRCMTYMKLQPMLKAK